MPWPYVRPYPRPSRLRRSTWGYNYPAAPPLAMSDYQPVPKRLSSWVSVRTDTQDSGVSDM